MFVSILLYLFFHRHTIIITINYDDYELEAKYFIL